MKSEDFFAEVSLLKCYIWSKPLFAKYLSDAFTNLGRMNSRLPKEMKRKEQNSQVLVEVLSMHSDVKVFCRSNHHAVSRSLKVATDNNSSSCYATESRKKLFMLDDGAL